MTFTAISYITDDKISVEAFRGESVPGPNTISQEENEIGKQRVTDIIHIFCGKAKDGTKFTDTYGLLEEIAMKIYVVWLDDSGPLEIEEKDRAKLISFGHAKPGVKAQGISKNREKVDYG